MLPTSHDAKKRFAIRDDQYLKKAIIITNYSCNLRCSYCDVEHLHKRMLKTEVLDNLLVALRANGAEAVHFIGGEPFLRKDLPILLARASELRMRTVVHSNGIFVRPLTDADVAHIDSFVTCLNGDRAAHEATRGSKTFDQALASIRWLRELGKEVVTDYIVTAQTAAMLDIRFVLTLARTLGFRVNFQPVFEHQLVSATRALVEPQTLPLKQLRELFSYIQAHYDPSVIWNSRVCIERAARGERPSFTACYNGIDSVVIDPTGSVARCFKDVQSKSNPNGLTLGWAEAFRRVRLDGCVTCPYSVHAEDNLAFCRDRGLEPMPAAAAAPVAAALL